MGAAFAALNAEAVVTDDGTDTTIDINGANITLLGVTDDQSVFTSLGQDTNPIGGVGINAFSTGDTGSYEAIRVITSDTPYNDEHAWAETYRPVDMML